jgi:hypothetical protein
MSKVPAGVTLGLKLAATVVLALLVGGLQYSVVRPLIKGVLPNDPNYELRYGAGSSYSSWSPLRVSR